MAVRPFSWRDIAALNRQRDQCVFLDSALLLTRGPHVMEGALLSYLAPGTGVITAIARGAAEAKSEETPHSSPADEPPRIGQCIHHEGSPYAHLTFLTPDMALDSPRVTELLEYLVGLCGKRGAFRLLADVDEENEAFEMLRRSSFAIYSRQRIWQLKSKRPEVEPGRQWRHAFSRDLAAIRALYNNLVPGLVQQVEPYVAQRPQGMVYYLNTDLLAYVELLYGPRGIWAQPFVHPDAEDVAEFMKDLIQKIPGRLSRPVYFCMRSYQSWLEPAIEELGAEAGPRQAVMVKYLAIQQKALRSLAIPSLDGGQPEITAPVAHLENK
jgi:hypothetical protein